MSNVKHEYKKTGIMPGFLLYAIDYRAAKAAS